MHGFNASWFRRLRHHQHGRIGGQGLQPVNHGPSLRCDDLGPRGAEREEPREISSGASDWLGFLLGLMLPVKHDVF